MLCHSRHVTIVRHLISVVSVSLLISLFMFLFFLVPFGLPDMAVKMPAKLQMILNPDDTRKLVLPNGIPETMAQLTDEVRKVCEIECHSDAS